MEQDIFQIQASVFQMKLEASWNGWNNFFDEVKLVQ